MAKSEDTFEVDAVTPVGTLGRRRKDGEETLGVLTPVPEGKPLTGDCISLKPREGEPRVYDVHVLYEGKKGPCRANSRRYRNNYDAVFGTQERNKPEADYNLN